MHYDFNWFFVQHFFFLVLFYFFKIAVSIQFPWLWNKKSWLLAYYLICFMVLNEAFWSKNCFCDQLKMFVKKFCWVELNNYRLQVHIAIIRFRWILSDSQILFWFFLAVLLTEIWISQDMEFCIPKRRTWTNHMWEQIFLNIIISYYFLHENQNNVLINRREVPKPSIVMMDVNTERDNLPSFDWSYYFSFHL